MDITFVAMQHRNIQHFGTCDNYDSTYPIEQTTRVYFTNKFLFEIRDKRINIRINVK